MLLFLVMDLKVTQFLVAYRMCGLNDRLFFPPSSTAYSMDRPSWKPSHNQYHASEML